MLSVLPFWDPKYSYHFTRICVFPQTISLFILFLFFLNLGASAQELPFFNLWGSVMTQPEETDATLVSGHFTWIGGTISIAHFCMQLWASAGHRAGTEVGMLGSKTLCFDLRSFPVCFVSCVCLGAISDWVCAGWRLLSKWSELEIEEVRRNGWFNFVLIGDDTLL